MFSSPKRNDVVTFVDKDSKRYVKRIIGLPNERIDYLNGYLYINGESYTENILNNVTTNNFTFEDIYSKDKCPEGIIPDDYYLVLGDNRPESQDSRDEKIGLINKKDIDGQIVFKVWPFKDFGAVY